MVGLKAEKNIVEVDEEQAKQWLHGEDLEINGNYSGFVIIKHNNYFLGTGKYTTSRILNYINKSRRINSVL